MHCLSFAKALVIVNGFCFWYYVVSSDRHAVELKLETSCLSFNCIDSHVCCVCAMQEQVDQFNDMAKKQIETVWKQYVILESTWMSLLFTHCLIFTCTTL